MKTTYTSILGYQFDTAALAQADENRLPKIIETYRNDVCRLQAGEPYAGRNGPHSQEMINDAVAALARYEAQWAEVQAQRAIASRPLTTLEKMKLLMEQMLATIDADCGPGARVLRRDYDALLPSIDAAMQQEQNDMDSAR